MKTKIEWCRRRLPDGTVPGYSFNPWWGCIKVSDECKFCYAEVLAKRWGYDIWGPAANTSRRFFGPKHWNEPRIWNAEAEKDGHRRNVFCASMADVFEDYPVLDTERTKLWNLIDTTPWLNWLLLTKRPENVVDMIPSRWWREGTTPTLPDNVWIGTSAGTQAAANERIPILLEIPAVVRFVSCEPMLEPVDFTPWLSRIDWMICGGESGAGHRPFDPEWARNLRRQCFSMQGHPVPFFFKQHGGQYHNSGGRLLDGREWNQMPPEVPEKRRLLA